jgi:DNA-binding NarL/FixJ family response regulator
MLQSVATRLLIVDDHDGFRSFVATLLASEGFDVVGDVEDGESALAAVRAQRPDVVLLDIQLPGADGFEVALQIADTPDAPEIVLTSSREASDYGRRLTQAPATAFIRKQDLSGTALEAALSGATRG